MASSPSTGRRSQQPECEVGCRQKIRLSSVSLSLTFAVLLIAGVIAIGLGALVALVLTLGRKSNPRRG
jgi:hypothetical protein